MTRTAFGIARAWLKCTRHFRTRTPSLRKLFGRRKDQPVVIAVGGNSFEGLERATAENILSILASGRLPIVTHGNGPQVGKLLRDHPEKTIAQCVDQTQREMGKQLKQEIRELSQRRGKSAKIKVIPTRVLVGPKDPAFGNPTKYIGRSYTMEELYGEKFKARKKLNQVGLFKVVRHDGSEWVMKEVEGENGKYRRVVASPKPLGIHPQDLSQILDNISQGIIVIAVGGGGVPIAIESTAKYVATQAVEAVIDKDLASALLARDLQARELIISTGVKEVALNWGKNNQINIGYMQARQALKHLKRGQFPVGSMGEKMEAAINALRFGVNTVLITSPESNWANEEGTLLTRGIDIASRINKLIKQNPHELQRWMVIQATPKPFSVGSALIDCSPKRPFQR